MQAFSLQLLDDLGHPCRVRHRGVGKRSARRLGRVRAMLPVHVVQPLGSIVVGRERVVVDRPRRRDAVEMFEGLEVFTPQAEERAAPELRVAADTVVCVRPERPPDQASLVNPPLLLWPVTAVLPHRFRIPVLLFLGHEVAALEDQDAGRARGQGVRHRAAARAGPDDDDVVTFSTHARWRRSDP
jgi:hypothetical protein